MLLLLAAACAPKLPPGPAPETPLLLWRVEREGKASHLLGTCHVGVDLDYALPAPHDATLEGARVVYTEASLDLGDPGRMVRLFWSDGPGLSERISQDRWRAVAHAVRDALPAPLFEHMQPWALAVILPMATAEGGLEGTKGGGMDLQIQKRAKARGIPVAHVETVEEQAAVLARFDDAFLASLGPSDAPDPAQADAISALCFRGDTTGPIIDPADPTNDALLTARNRAWMPKLAPDLAEGGAFVAVGAAHMLGDQGLLSLLRAEGYTITQLTTTRPVSDERMPLSEAPILPAPPPRPDLDRAAGVIAAPIAASLCADGQLMRTCFEPDAAACTARVTTDARLCVLQHDDRLPTGGDAPSKELIQDVAACAPVGLVMDAIADDRVGDAPMCNLLKTAMGL